jgi:hypothetical protein
MSEKKKIFYPLSVEEVLNTRPTSIKKEKETDFEQRRSNMEKDALKEEKLRYSGLQIKIINKVGKRA